MNPDFFFPEKGERVDIHKSINRVKAVCMGCVVRLSCLEAGLAEKDGIWGGLSGRERRIIRRRRLLGKEVVMSSDEL
jgi:hypothetical protein